MLEYSMTQTQRGSSRRGSTNSMKLIAKENLKAMGGPVVDRQSRSARQPVQLMRSQQDPEEEYDTESDPNLRTNIHRRRPMIEQQEPETNPGRSKRARSAPRGQSGGHRLVWLGGTALVLIALYCLVGTIGAAFWVSHCTDPAGNFGSLHGEAISADFAENQATPVTVVGTIIHDQVLVTVINGNNSKLYTGPNLALNGFPDPDSANVELQSGNFGGNHLDLKVTILSDQFPTPFSRFSVVEFLYGNGDGTFKAAQPQQ
jgi:hypothetical protein